MVNKYGYLTSGKTIDNSTMLTNEQALTFAMLKVANELAEANRLERIKMERKYGDPESDQAV